MSFVLGVTGSIATGKSTVIHVFREQGFPIVDGDVVARKVVEPGQPCLAVLTEYFGAEILLDNGELNRKKLGQIVFSDEGKRVKLNELMDTYIRQEITAEIAAGKELSPLVVVDIPLLYEGNYQQYMDAVAVVYVSLDIQLERLMARDGFTKEQALERIESQWSIDKKREMADIVFDNRGSKAETQQQVLDWLKENRYI